MTMNQTSTKTALLHSQFQAENSIIYSGDGSDKDPAHRIYQNTPFQVENSFVRPTYAPLPCNQASWIHPWVLPSWIPAGSTPLRWRIRRPLERGVETIGRRKNSKFTTGRRQGVSVSRGTVRGVRWLTEGHLSHSLYLSLSVSLWGLLSDKRLREKPIDVCGRDDRRSVVSGCSR